MPHFPIKRDQLKPDEVLCSYCTALCCRYFSLPIDTPTTREDFDNLRWFMMHGRVTAYVEDRIWYLCVYGDCKHLQDDYRCGIYYDRPHICRAYSTNHCEYDDQGLHDMYFENSEQIWEYAEAVLPPQRKPKGKAAGRVSLPILN